MTTPTASSQQVLDGILATLLRLESHFQNDNHDQNLSQSPNDNYRNTWVEALPSKQDDVQSRHLDSDSLFPSQKEGGKVFRASAYLASVHRLQALLQLEAQSEIVDLYNSPESHNGAPLNASAYGQDTKHNTQDFDLAVPETDAHSMSFYPSRPLSQLNMNIPPVPAIPLDFPPFFQTTESETLEDRLAFKDIISVNYGDLQESPVSSNVRSSSSKSLNSLSTARTSISLPDVKIKPHFNPKAKRSTRLNPQPFKFSFKHLPLSRSNTKTTGITSPNIPTEALVAEEEPPFTSVEVEVAVCPTCGHASVNPSSVTSKGSNYVLEVRRALQSGGKACVSMFPRAGSWVARSLMNQQMKGFEMRAR
jgi:hypothetical protein